MFTKSSIDIAFTGIPTSIHTSVTNIMNTKVPVFFCLFRRICPSELDEFRYTDRLNLGEELGYISQSQAKATSM